MKTKTASAEKLKSEFKLAKPVLELTANQIDSKLPKAAQVYELMRSAIITTALPPGALIVEKEICEALEISRTPLREAIILLSRESLVMIKPSGGTFVNLIDLREVLNGQLTRDTIENRIVKLAARHFDEEISRRFEVCLFQQESASRRRDMNEFFELDNQFHKLICECSGFPNAWKTIHSTTGQLDRVKRYALSNEDHFVQSYKQHKEIFELIKAHDEKGASRAFQHHIGSLFREVELIRKIDPELILHSMEVSEALIK